MTNKMSLQLNKVHNIDVLQGLKQLDSDSIDCVITSPPYWALRDYGVEGQLGLEPTFKEYLQKLLHIFDEIKRVLKSSGTCWVNIGDTYWGGGQGGADYGGKETTPESAYAKVARGNSFQSKCMVGIPERFMLGMIDRGWILRNKIIWHKPNCMPSSAKDRFTVDFEPIFFFVKSKKYFFDMPREAQAEVSLKRAEYEKHRQQSGKEISSIGFKSDAYGMPARFVKLNPNGRAGRTVWRITTQPFSEAHFATFPEELVKKPLLAGCPRFVCRKCGKPREKIVEKTEDKVITSERGNYDYHRIRRGNNKEDGRSGWDVIPGQAYKETFVGWSDCGCNAGYDGGTVLDPFMGSGTVGVVARKHSRNFIGFELSKEYVEIADKRLKPFMEQLKLSEVT